MNVSFNGKSKDFSQCLADWLAKDARYWHGADEPAGTIPSDWNLEQIAKIMEGRDAEDFLRLLQLMVDCRQMFENMVSFAARYKSAVRKATAQDVQRALDLIAVAEVQQQ